MASLSQSQTAALGPGYANALTGQTAQALPAPRTIATALSGMEALNERLSNLRQSAGHLCELIGGPFPASNGAAKDQPPSSGAVGRFNDVTEAAHNITNDIENLLNSISRSLG